MKTKTYLVRQGFTLVELLMVIAIISILAGLFSIAYRGALQESNSQKTLSTITKISEVLNSRMEEYATYPVVLRQPGGAIIPASAFPLPSAPDRPDTKTLLLERARLLLLRETIAMEMPDHPNDFKWTDAWVTTANAAAFFDNLPRAVFTGLGEGTSGTPVAVRNGVTSRTRRMAGKLSQFVSGVGPMPIPGWQNSNANAELLFLIVEDSQLNGSSAIELFRTSEIGDTDGDGLNEFLDAFGNAIGWLRWPVGFEGIARFHPDMLDPTIISPSRGVSIESDPFDRMSADPGYYPGAVTKPGPGAFPLVVSAGPDGEFGIRLFLTVPTSAVDTPSNGKPSYLNGSLITDPWVRSSTEQLGGIIDPKTSGDNITNYSGNGATL